MIRGACKSGYLGKQEDTPASRASGLAGFVWSENCIKIAVCKLCLSSRSVPVLLAHCDRANMSPNCDTSGLDYLSSCILATDSGGAGLAGENTNHNRKGTKT